MHLLPASTTLPQLGRRTAWYDTTMAGYCDEGRPSLGEEFSGCFCRQAAQARKADSPWTGSDGQGFSFPLVLLHHIIIAQGKPVKLTYHQQFAIIITVTKGLIEEELEEVGVFLFNYLLTRRPPFLLLPCPPLFLSRASWIATFYSPGFVSSPT